MLNRVLFFFGMVLCAIAVAQEPTNASSEPTLIQRMAGTWEVQQRMWPGFGAEAVNLPPAVARSIEDGKQVVQLYLKPQAGGSRHEFLAFEHIYTRER